MASIVSPSHLLGLGPRIVGLISYENGSSSPTAPVADLFLTQPLELAVKMVTVSHYDLNRVMELVEVRHSCRPGRLGRGIRLDWKMALGAASHMGNRLIAKLIAFVQEFGPVMGKVLSTTIEDNGTVTITVEQSMERLRQEQREFAGAVTLVQQVNKKRNTYGRGLRGIVSGNVRCSSSRNLDDDDEQFSLNPRLHQAKAASILPLAHQALCMFAERVPSKTCSL